MVKKIGVHFLEMLLVNAHYLYKAYSPTKRAVRINHFREEVVKWLVGEPLRPASLRPRANFHYLGRIFQNQGKKTTHKSLVSDA